MDVIRRHLHAVVARMWVGLGVLPGLSGLHRPFLRSRLVIILRRRHVHARHVLHLHRRMVVLLRRCRAAGQHERAGQREAAGG
ncbi:MAG: hypothetical protein ABWX87_13880, partial [Pseudoxanthomonas sp.]